MPLVVWAFPGQTTEIGHIETYSDQFIEPGGVLSIKELVLGMVKEAGFDPKIADKVIQAESGWNSRAIGDSGNSWGLWQIHQPAHPIGEVCAFDPVCSTEYAIKLLKSERSWNHWTAYRKLYEKNR